MAYQQFSGKEEHYPARGEGGITHYARYWQGLLSIYSANAVLGVGTVRISPIDVWFPITIDRLIVCAGVAAGNIRLGIYADNGDTPAGGALLGESASVAAILNKNELAMTVGNVSLVAGRYWVGIQNDNGALNIMITHSPSESLGGTLEGQSYAQGYGAFQNPCPVVAPQTIPPFVYVRVASVP